jgi:hypothetical protein
MNRANPREYWAAKFRAMSLRDLSKHLMASRIPNASRGFNAGFMQRFNDKLVKLDCAEIEFKARSGGAAV